MATTATFLLGTDNAFNKSLYYVYVASCQAVSRIFDKIVRIVSKEVRLQLIKTKCILVLHIASLDF